MPRPRIHPAIEELAKRLYQRADQAAAWTVVGDERRAPFIAEAHDLVNDLRPLLCGELEEERDELQKRFEELRDRRAEEGCDECEDRREKAEQELKQVRTLATERLEVVDRLASQLAEVRAEVERKAEGSFELYQQAVKVKDRDGQVVHGCFRDAFGEVLAILDSAPSVAGDGEQRGEEGFEHCKRCGRGNTVWSAPSPLWNAVMRGGSINGDPIHGDMVCATCFMALAEEAGIASHFRVFAEQVNIELETVTPSGRVWDEDRQLWTDPASTQQLPGKSLSREPGDREQLEAGLERAIKRLRKVGPNEVHHLSVNVRTQVASELEELLPAQQSADPEVPRCGGSGKHRVIAVEGEPVEEPFDVPCEGCHDCRVTKVARAMFAPLESEGFSPSASQLQEAEVVIALVERTRTAPPVSDCQSTPELLGEEAKQSEEVAAAFARCLSLAQNREQEHAALHLYEATKKWVEAASTQPESPGNYCDQCEKPKAEVASLFDDESLCASCLLVRVSALLKEAEGHDFKLTDADHCPFCGQDIAAPESPENSGGVEEGAVPVVRAEPDDDGIVFHLECGHSVGLALEDLEATSDTFTLPTALVCPTCTILSVTSTQPPSPPAEVQDCETCGGSEEVEVTVGVGNDRIPERKPCPDCTGKQSPAEPDCDDLCTCGHERFHHDDGREMGVETNCKATRNGEPCTCEQFEMVDDEEVVEQSPAELQGDVVEVLAKELVKKDGWLPWDALTKRSKELNRRRARDLLAAITPVLPGSSYARDLAEAGTKAWSGIEEALDRFGEGGSEEDLVASVRAAQSCLLPHTRASAAASSPPAESYALELRERLESLTPEGS
jgi:hypothetical protein